MEIQPSPESSVKGLGLEQYVPKAFSRRLASLESALDQPVRNEELEAELLSALNEVSFHKRADEGALELTALGYDLEAIDDDSAVQRIISSQYAFYFDADILELKDRRRLLLRFELQDSNEVVYVPPKDVLLIENASLVDLEGDEEASRLQDKVNKVVDLSMSTINDPDFLLLSAWEQRQLLDGICEEMSAEIELDYHQELKRSLPVTCYDYYEVSYRDGWLFERTRHLGASLKGRYITTLYLESPPATYPRQITSLDDFNLGYKTPCIVLDDGKHKQVYFIPIAAITAIGKNEEGE